jgi:acyl-CoA synthetase (AMP-forming)/AMP-acid ligase II
VRGPTVFKGYDRPAGDPDAGFVNGWFRTGDLGSIDSDGFLTLIGRMEDMVDQGTARIALSQIDIAFEQHPAVAEAVGFTLPAPDGGQEVAVAVVLEDGASVNALALRRFMRPRLSEIDAPRRIEFDREIPFTLHGKPIRNELGLMLGLVDMDTIINDPIGSHRMPALAEVAATLNRALRS